MKATLLIRDRALIETSFWVELVAELVAWQVPSPVRGSTHLLKYRFALIADGNCVMRYDNEAGKGDHMHVGNKEVKYEFTSLERLQADFWQDVARLQYGRQE